jgi:transcriptional regulator with XRE-family HTH domain
MSSDTLREAVKRLRNDLGKTQTEFGVLIGKGLATIQRYETLVPPKGKVLLRLERLAREKGFNECADVFREALLADLGLNQPNTEELPLPFPRMGGVVVAGPETSEQENRVAALNQLMRESLRPGAPGEQARKEIKIVDRGLRRVREMLLHIGGANLDADDRTAAVVRLHRRGLKVAEIAETLGIQETAVQNLLSAAGEE